MRSIEGAKKLCQLQHYQQLLRKHVNASVNTVDFTSMMFKF